jgi:hypothetical protein
MIWGYPYDLGNLHIVGWIQGVAHSRLVAEICENLNLNPSSCFEFICWPHLPIHSSISFHFGWGPSCFWPWYMVDLLRTSNITMLFMGFINQRSHH